MSAPPPDPNIGITTAIAEAIGELREQLVFVGGSAAGLLVSNVRAQAIRMTEDVDLVAEAATADGYREMERRFEALGFQHDLSDRAPICRWVLRGNVVDLLPMTPEILGFSNRWYPLAVQTSRRVALPSGMTIRLITAPLFIATKLEAFKGRGQGDYLASHDMEDIITIVDGRHELVDETRQAPQEVVHYLSEEIRKLLADSAFVASINGHLPSDRASQMRAPGLMGKLQKIGQLA